MYLSEVDEVNFYLVESRLHNRLLENCYLVGSKLCRFLMKLIVIWSGLGFTINCFENCYLVGSRLRRFMMKLIIIWSGPGFTMNWLRTVIWSGPGFADF